MRGNAEVGGAKRCCGGELLGTEQVESPCAAGVAGECQSGKVKREGPRGPCLVL